MGFLEKLSEALSESAEQIGKKSSEILEVNKLNLNIAKKEKEIEELYGELGRHVFQYLKGVSHISRGELQAYIHRIEHLQNNIQTLEKLVLKIQGVQHCPRCKVEFNEKISYCPLCGKYIKDLT